MTYTVTAVPLNVREAESPYTHQHFWDSDRPIVTSQGTTHLPIGSVKAVLEIA
jgi:hypothetical protein